MAPRNNELRPRSYNELMHAAGDRRDEDAIAALRKFQAIRDAGHTPEIQYSEDHGWVVTDPMKDTP